MFKLIKRLILIIFILILLGVGSVYYAFKIEPYRVVTRNYDLNESTSETVDFKIAQISDLHIKSDFTYEDLDKVVEKVNAQHPSVVIFSGDLYDHYETYNDDENIIQELSKIKAKYGKIAIWGNRDIGGGTEYVYDYIMERSGFTVLKNDYKFINLDSGKKILFTGLDDSILGSPSIPSTGGVTANYAVLLTHEPDVVDNYSNYMYDVALSGHSHGGQFHLPLLEPINEKLAGQTELCDKYDNGMYDLDGNISKIFVNTGIGTTHISARFGVAPEVSMLHVYL